MNQYDHVFHPGFKHLHGAAVAVGDLLFAGYSDCETQWGLNPVWRTLLTEVEGEHRPLLVRLAAAEATDRAQRTKIDDACDSELREITAKARDWRRRSYKARLQAVERKRERFAPSRVDRVRETRVFRAYSAAAAPHGARLHRKTEPKPSTGSDTAGTIRRAWFWSRVSGFTACPKIVAKRGYPNSEDL